MTAKPADEKRQEERRIKELREFQRSSPANRRCFDCNEMMPQYVCLDFNTFVCTSCSGIHREFAHRVKSISMSKFTETEVKNMIKFGGNDAAQKYWRSKHDPSFRPNGGTDGERTRNFIRLTYIDRKWVYESPRHASKTDDQPQASSSKSSKSASKPAPRTDDFFSDGGGFDAFGSNDAPSGKGNEGFASFGDFSAFESNTATAQTSQGFGDFGAFGESSAASPAATPTPAPAQGFDDFGSFDAVSSSASTPAAPARQEFASFKIAPPPDFQFSPASSTVASTPVRDNTHTKSSNDFLAFSPENKKSSDPFAFDEPGAAATTTSSTASPFDAFGAPAPPNVSATPSFDAFGGSSAPSPFDAFSAAAPSSSSGAAPVDPFGGKPVSNLAGSGLDVFGAPNTRSQSNSALDPFGGFSAGASSGTSKPEPAKPIGASVDPFAAFDGLDSVATTAPSSDPNTSSFTSAQNGGAQLTGFPSVGGSGLPSQPPQPTPSSDPFAFASGEAAIKTSSFGMAGGSTAPPNRTNSSGQGFAAFPQPQPAHQLQPQVNVSVPGYNPNAFMQQQHQAAPQQWFGQQHPSFPGGYVQPQQTMPGAFHPPPTAVPSRESSSSQLKTASGSAASINDPFASLSISNTFGGSNTGSTNPGGPGSAPGSRGASFEHQQPLSSASPAAPFAFPAPPGNPMVGANAPFGDPSGGSAPGSRGQSFQSAQPMGGMASSSPASSFSFPPQATSVPLQPSQSPMGSFSFPNQAGTAAPAPSFGAFQSSGNTSRPNSFTGAPAQPPPPSANPFDMF